MVDHSSDQSLTPPRFAAALIAFVAGPKDRDVVIGDLTEEFAALSRASARGARRWYWRQTARSLPRLLTTRVMRSPAARRVAATMLAAAGAFLLMNVWDILIARTAARAFQGIINAPSFTPARILYFSILAVGFALVGGIVAITTFSREQPFFRNALYRLGPVALALFAPAVFSIATKTYDYPIGVRLLQLGLVAPALFLGAHAAMRLISKKKR